MKVATLPDAPRSGGRTAARASSDSSAERPLDRGYPTDGTAALRPEPARLGRFLRAAPPLPVSVPRAPFVALVLFLVVGGVLGILLLNTRINENAFRLDHLRQEQARLDLTEQQLTQELAEREAAGNLEAEVRRNGGVPAGTPAYLRLPDGKVFGEPKPATGEPSVTSQNGGR